jgi:hypothetical protein
LFGYVNAFLTDLEKAVHENKARAAAQARQAAKEATRKPGAAASAPVRETGLMDELIARMKNGSAFQDE